jgi:hypothetical protein
MLENDEFLINSLELLKKINNTFHIQEIIDYFNKIDYDYYNMNDLEMIIEYIRIKLNNKTS